MLYHSVSWNKTRFGSMQYPSSVFSFCTEHFRSERYFYLYGFVFMVIYLNKTAYLSRSISPKIKSHFTNTRYTHTDHFLRSAFLILYKQRNQLITRINISATYYPDIISGLSTKHYLSRYENTRHLPLPISLCSYNTLRDAPAGVGDGLQSGSPRA